MKAKQKQHFNPRSSKRFSPYGRSPTGRQNLFLAGIFVFLVVGIGGVLVFNNIQLFQKTQELRIQADTLRSQKDNLEALKAQLEQGISQSQTPEYQEKILREKGLYQKPGEQVITVVPEVQKQETPAKPAKVWWNPRTWF